MEFSTQRVVEAESLNIFKAERERPLVDRRVRLHLEPRLDQP